MWLHESEPPPGAGAGLGTAVCSGIRGGIKGVCSGFSREMRRSSSLSESEEARSTRPDQTGGACLTWVNLRLDEGIMSRKKETSNAETAH